MVLVPTDGPYDLVIAWWLHNGDFLHLLADILFK